jgi:Fur family ferric uptake transcriptional regulator
MIADAPTGAEWASKVDSDEIRKAGLKVTLPRVKILEILASGGGRHMSAEDIYRRLIDQGEEIGLATVYRVLTQFEQADLVTRHHFEGGTSVFELNQGEHHDHIVCVDCGIEQLQLDVASRLGFDIAEHNLILYGRCRRKDCPNRKPRRGSAG